MKRGTIVLAGVLLVALFLLQEKVLARTEVQKLERASQNLKEMSAPALLPTYIGSLFLGSFRAVAIDILWIQMQRMGEEEHRYFERVEIMDLITKLQPRNPEAWAYMGWDCAYNIANQYRTEDDVENARKLEEEIKLGGPNLEERTDRLDQLRTKIAEKDKDYRIWIQKGILKLAEGCRHLPEDAYLKHEVGKALWTKAAWSNGILEKQFLVAVEEDKELQRVLGEGLRPPRPRTAFELGEAWFERGKATLERQIAEGRFRVYRTLAESMARPPEEDRQHHTTQMGLNIDIAAFVGFIHEMRFLNGILKWSRAREADQPEKTRTLLLEASDSFRKAEEQALVFRHTHSLVKAGERAFHDARADLCREMARLCAEQATVRHPLTPAEQAGLLARLELIWWNPVDRNARPSQQVPPPDERYILDYMSRLKQSLGGDAMEYNDDRHALHRGNLLMPGEKWEASIAPDVGDVDWYHFYAARHPARKDIAEIASVFTLKRTGAVPLKVVALAMNKGAVTTEADFELNDANEVTFKVTSDHEGVVFLRVTAIDAGSDSKDRGYTITALGVQR
jgi:hypothetical protein